MSHALSIMNPLAMLACCAALAQNELAVSPVRLPGASLDTSLRNEADRAVRQSARWLAARQQADGAWGVTNRLRLTALVVTALAASSCPEGDDARTRATLWLGGTAATPLTSLGDHAWRLLALSVSLPDTPGRHAYLHNLASRAPSDTAGASAEDRRLWREALLHAGQEAPPAPEAEDEESRALLAHAAAAWPPALDGTRALWRLARLINRSAGGQLLRGQTPLDWRNHMASRLITAQKNDPEGGCFWPAADPDRQLAETAYGILGLLEL
ncbi:MAG: hypothetical protein WC328_04455 [Kiritimatiellia bacterium]|jgi:hypothetical protein|nr:hypothetical protein [Kiritimatiellia bacterium]MDD4172697.1 hypothetical protein [Kiritimatiellia bacterium]MDD4440495.1 hypothetical protein [Kiritimatiellia bacterium]